MAAIDDAKGSMEKVERAIDGESTEGTDAVGYIDGSTLRAVEVSMAGETFRATSDIYFGERGEVIFIREVEERYDKPMYEPGFVVANRISRRYHFVDGKALLVEENGSTVERERSQQMADAALAFAFRVTAAIRQPESSPPSLR